jgi:hypothetical protein
MRLGIGWRSKLMSKKKPPKPADIVSMRGVASFDTNEIIVLVHAPVEPVAEAFKEIRKLKNWTRNANGQFIEVANPSYLVYQLRGHIWTIVDCYHGQARMVPDHAKALSKTLKTKAIFYGNSDTAGVTAYELFDNGKLLEHFELGDDGVNFTSDLRNVDAPDDDTEVYDFVDEFFKSHNAFAPSWSVYLGGWNQKPGQRVQMQMDGKAVERVDFLS